MDNSKAGKIKDTFENIDSLLPFYSNTQSTAKISNCIEKQLLVSAVFDEINIMKVVSTRDHKNKEKITLEVVHKIENNDEQEITVLDITSNGRYLTYVNQAQLVTIRDMNSPDYEIKKTFKLSSPSYCLVSDLISSNLLAIGCTDGSISVYDIDNGYITHTFKGHGGIISSMKIFGELENLNDWYLLSGDTNGSIKVWDLMKRKQLYSLQEHQSAIRGIDISRTSDEDFLVVSGGRDDILNVYSMKSSQSRNKKTMKVEKTIPTGLQIEACGLINNEYLYTAGGDGIYNVYNIEENGKPAFKTAKPLEDLFIVGVVPQFSNMSFNEVIGFHLVYSDQTISKIDVNNIFDKSNEFIPITYNIAGNHGTIADMRFVGPCLNKLALATNSNTLRVVPIDDNKYECEMYEAHTDLLNSLDATEDGYWIVTASKDNSAILWQYHYKTDSFKPYCKFVGHIGSITAVALPNIPQQAQQQRRKEEGPDSKFFVPPKWVITASSDMTIKKWSVPQQVNPDALTIVSNSDFTRKAHDKDINSIDVSPNDAYLATASYDKTCKIWNIPDLEQITTLQGHKRGLWDVKFCQYDKLLVTSSGDKTCKIWSFKENDQFKQVGTLQGHSNAVQRAFFINGSKQIVSCGAEGLLKVWTLVNNEFECLKTLDAHNNRIWAMLPRDDGEFLVSADADGVFQIWKDNSEEEQEKQMLEKKKEVEEEQSLNNYLRNGDWLNAFYLALKLDHPMRMYNVLNQCVVVNENNDVNEFIFNKELDKAISNLDDEQLLILVKRCRDWNTNAKTFHIAGKVIRCILLNYNITHLIEIKGLVKVINTIVPYLTRHYNRLDNLLEDTYILDYCLSDMDNHIV
ncbi:Utp13 protein [Hanseniaspora uvarum]|nr:Utp13 protein [Hanseniaspora uvarum]